MKASTNTDQLEQDLTALDALAHYVARHLEDAASEDPALRRRFSRLVGLLADRAAQRAARSHPPSPPPNSRLRGAASSPFADDRAHRADAPCQSL